MSFADELRDMPEHQKNEDWAILIQKWYDRIRQQCISGAKHGQNYTSSSLRYLLQDIEDTLIEGSTDSAWWNRIKSRVECSLNPKHSERRTICLSEEDIDDLSNKMTEMLEQDGFVVKTNKKKYQKYTTEFVPVERSDGERLATGVLNLIFSSMGLGSNEDGYKEQKVEDGFRYDLTRSVRW